jgi:hypothetical protein
MMADSKETLKPASDQDSEIPELSERKPPPASEAGRSFGSRQNQGKGGF